MANPSNPAGSAGQPPPPFGNLPFIELRADGQYYLSIVAMDFLQKLWAALAGNGGVIDQTTQQIPALGIDMALASSVAALAATSAALITRQPPVTADLRYATAFSLQDASTAALGAAVGRYAPPLVWTLPIALRGSSGFVTTAPTADTAFDIQLNGVSVATATFLNGATAATFTCAATIRMVPGDDLSLVAPAGLNGLAGAMTITLAGLKG